MSCQHTILSVIVFRGEGTCDQCGSPIEIDGHYGYYIGDNSRGHVFMVRPRVPCHGCRSMLGKIHVPCGEGWRVKELEQEMVDAVSRSRVA